MWFWRNARHVGEGVLAPGGEQEPARELRVDARGAQLEAEPREGVHRALAVVDVDGDGAGDVVLGGAGADFAGSGYQNTYSTALTWTRTLSPSLIMEWRAGYVKYHNEALSAGTGLDTSTEVGIPGANYDEFSSGISRIVLQNGFGEPMTSALTIPTPNVAATTVARIRTQT